MSILPHACVRERDPHGSGGGRVRAFGAAEEIRIVDSRAVDDFTSFAEACAEISAGPFVVCVDELAELLAAVDDRRAAAAAQRAELHLDLDDDRLRALAVRSIYPRRPVWRRLVARFGGAR